MNLTFYFSPTWFYCFHAAFSVEASDFQTRWLWELRFKSLSNRFARVLAEVLQLSPEWGFEVLTHSSEWIWAAEPHVHLPTAERLPRSLAVIGALRIIYKSIRMQWCCSFEWDSLTFFNKEKNIRLFCSLKTQQEKSKIIFLWTLTQRICHSHGHFPTFVNTMFLINHHHECQHNCARFCYDTNKEHFFFVGKKVTRGGKKDRNSVWKIIYWVVNSWTCIALFHNFWKVHFLHILCFKYGKLFV